MTFHKSVAPGLKRGRNSMHTPSMSWWHTKGGPYAFIFLWRERNTRGSKRIKLFRLAGRYLLHSGTPSHLQSFSITKESFRPIQKGCPSSGCLAAKMTLAAPRPLSFRGVHISVIITHLHIRTCLSVEYWSRKSDENADSVLLQTTGGGERIKKLTWSPGV